MAWSPYPADSALSVLLRCCTGSALPRVLSRAVALAAAAGLVIWINSKTSWTFHVHLDATIFLGVLLIVLLGARLVASHARHWAAAVALHRMLGTCVALFSSALAWADSTDLGVHTLLVRQLALFLVSVELALTPGEDAQDTEDYMAQLASFKVGWKPSRHTGPPELLAIPAEYRPAHAVAKLKRTFHTAVARGWTSELAGMRLDAMSTDLSVRFAELVGTHNSQFPFAFAQLTKLTSVCYLVALPMALQTRLGLTTIPVNFVVALLIFGADEAAVMMDDPFRRSQDPLLPVSLQVRNAITTLEDLLVEARKGRPVGSGGRSREVKSGTQWSSRTDSRRSGGVDVIGVGHTDRESEGMPLLGSARV